MERDTLNYPEDYPPEVFRVCGRDLSRIFGRIKATRSAEDLTTLARRLIQDRLQSGFRRDAPIVHPVTDRDQVRLWDPADAWHVGDRALFAVPEPGAGARSFVPRVGEVTQVRGKAVVVRLDGETGARIYGAAPAFGDAVGVVEWRQSVEDLVSALGDSADENAQVDSALWHYGEEIVTGLLAALRHDGRFCSLEGRWYLRSLAALPSATQLESLAHAMLPEVNRPLTAAELSRWVPPPVHAGDSGLFGLALGLHQRPDLFTNVDSDARPRWVLAGPPPGDLLARYAAFDPESFALLCEPGDVLAPETVQRLWELDLLGVVVERRMPKSLRNGSVTPPHQALGILDGV